MGIVKKTVTHPQLSRLTFRVESDKMLIAGRSSVKFRLDALFKGNGI